jgi:regulator of cell morphogenesis and NO signaling
MTITASTLVADIAVAKPATIKVFQRHRIDFCCGGKIPLSEVCQRQRIETQALIAELDAALVTAEAATDWTRAPLADLVSHIQRRFHRPLEAELPRLRAMLEKVVSRHGDHLPETLLPLRSTFAMLQSELLEHMAREDAVLFPAVIALEHGTATCGGGASAPRAAAREDWTWLERPIGVLELEHASAGAALERIATLTNGYVPPDGSCPTFRGLYHGLAELERDMHEHVHLENNVLFPRAALLARSRSRQLEDRATQ